MKKLTNDIKEFEKDFEEEFDVIKQEIEAQHKKSFPEKIKYLFSLSEDVASHDEIKDRILSGGKFTGTNMCVLVLAILIASVGLNTGSTAVIIGAMLISPLMGSILAMAYGTTSVNIDIVTTHALGFITQIIISILTSTIYFSLSPIKDATSELLARTQPRFFDVIIAICGGLAGIIGQTRKDKANNIIPGVAIATALMPPLCTCGYAIANRSFKMFAGASYLFLVNTYFIYMSSTIILSILQVPKVKDLSDKQWKRLRKSMIRNAFLISIPTIIIGILMVYE